LVLETLSHAKARGAAIYAQLAGWANNNDAYHVTAPEPEGKMAAACMRSALAMAGLTPQEVGYINAHGTGTRDGDQAEVQALHAVFSQSCPAISSTKGATGHMMGAGGITEAIVCIQALRTGVLPPTLGLETPLDGLDFVTQTSRHQPVSVAMTNAFGFGGQNSTLIFRSVP
jgi:3-oxoacyl-[acyl-carrier-protein] synthase II